MADLTKVKKSVMEESQILPDMSGQSGMLLSNNGSMPVWVAGRIIGEICRFSFDNPPPGFFALDGSTITNGKIDFPALASSGSRFITISGNNIVLKDFVDFGRGKGSSGRAIGTYEIDQSEHYDPYRHHNVDDYGKYVGGRKDGTYGVGNLYAFCGVKTAQYHGNKVDLKYDSFETRPKSLTELVCIYHGVL